MFLIIKEVKETTLDFSQGTVDVLLMCHIIFATILQCKCEAIRFLARSIIDFSKKCH